jgi:hypothetical protein
MTDPYDQGTMLASHRGSSIAGRVVDYDDFIRLADRLRGDPDCAERSG